MNLVYHGDPYIVEQEINELKSQIDNGDPNSTNINVFDSNEVNADTILNACYSIPFLSSKRLVIIKGLLSIFESKSSSRIRVSKTNQKPKPKRISDWDSIVDELPKFPQTTLLIFSDSHISENNRLLTKIKSNATIKYFPPPTGHTLIKWVKEKKPLTDKITSFDKSEYAVIENKSLVKNKDQIEKNINNFLKSL